ncbi:MAG TPA: M14 family zinc carboxypeptidase [Bryobacteraceae bacterium]|jgi:hypothetical protein|nr:M14 family zinc carboxypeptidase [Bryobacteraceae bacterium]
MRLTTLIASFLLFSSLARPAIPTPEEYFGFRMGTDRKLARYDKIVDYFQLIASQSDRVRVHNLGPTTNNHPFALLEISSADNIKNLDKYKALQRKLYFQGGAPTAAERDEIFKSGKAVVLITNNIHSTEIGSSQMVVELVHQLATTDSPRVHKILDNVIFLLVPSLNPDGQMLVTDWYNKNVGTQYEPSPLPTLFHPYVGHDNNRDMYLFSQRESRMAAGILWDTETTSNGLGWFPSIWLDEHQQGSAGPRIFTMPATDPINPNVDTLIYRLNTIYGQQQAAALEAEGKEGIIFNATYTNFWEGAMAWSGWWHNQVGLLTEVASARIATPVVQQKADPSRPAAAAGANGNAQADFENERRRAFEHPDDPLPPPRDINARTEYPHPWMGGTWTLRDIVDYELIATYALLESSADSRDTLLHEIYSVNQRTIEQGQKGIIGGGKDKNYAAIIPFASQHDPAEAVEVVDKLRIGGVEVYRAKNAFEQDGKQYPAGTFVIPFNQVFGRYAKDMLEKQTYPEVRRSPGAPPEAPYDVSAWSLGMQFGVDTPFAKTPLPKDLQMEKLTATPKLPLTAATTSSGEHLLLYDGATSSMVLNRLLKSGAHVSFDRQAGTTWLATKVSNETWEKCTAGFELMRPEGDRYFASRYSVHLPRVALYQPWNADMDEGWTRWVFDHYEMPYTLIHNKDVKTGKLREKFDAIVLPDQRERDILEGLDYKSIVPEYRGGIGDDGWKSLQEFIAEGGTIVALGDSSNLLIDKLPLPVKELKHSLNREQHFAPGAVVNLQVDETSPVGLGVAPQTYGFYINSPFFQVMDGFSYQKVGVVARYPNSNVNASGWMRGEDLMFGHAAVVSVNMSPGKIVLFGIRPQHRAQTHATLPLLFNALYWSTEEPAQ